MNKDDKKLNSIIDEYKMSTGGSFFNNTLTKGHDAELEMLAVENAVENHLFDTYQLL